MAMSEAQKRADAKYKASSVKRFVLKFCPPEEETYQHLKSMGNMSGFLKSAIQMDMRAQKTNIDRNMCIEDLAEVLVCCEPGTERFDAAARIMQRKLEAYFKLQASFEGE